MPELDTDEVISSKLDTVLGVDLEAEVRCDGRDVVTLELCIVPATYYIVCAGPDHHRFHACQPHKEMLAIMAAMLSPAIREAKMTCGHCNGPWDLIDGWQLL